MKAKELFDSILPEGVTGTQEIYEHVAKHNLHKAAIYDGVCLMMHKKLLTDEQAKQAVRSIRGGYEIKAVRTLTQG